MRIFYSILMVASLAFAAAPASAQYSSSNRDAPAIDIKPISPPTTINSGPVIQSITARFLVQAANGVILDVVPDFHFTAPKGNAIVLRRELVDTDGAFSQTNIANATINIPAEAQKKGAVISGGWRCGVQQYYITLRATILDADGYRSNPVEYTIHCNGG